MRIVVPVAAVVCALLAVAPKPVAAQSRPRPAARPTSPLPRVSIGISGGYQATTTEFDDAFDFTIYQETGSTRVTYPVEAGPLFDVSGGVRLWRGLGVGLAVSRFALDGVAATTTSVPHPLFLGQNRQVIGEGDAIRREESGIHVQAQYLVAVGRKLHVTLMAGPSVLQVNQALVIDVNYTQEYPYDTATFTGVDSRRVKASAVGFNAGADVRWMFSRTIGAGVLVRFTRATVDLDAADNRTISVDAGGTQIGAGVRFAF
jgi:hypothetical protein